MKKILKLEFIPQNIDVALLLLRVWVGLSLFIKHGIEKLMHFSEMQQHFPDPLHIGITPSLSYALLSDSICSVLVMIGLRTRLAALIITINLLVVFAAMHQFSFTEKHAEMVYIYLGIFISILMSGAGKFSIDHKWLQ